MTALICAVQEGHWEVAEFLLQESMASVDQMDGVGRTALMVAAAEGHLGVMELLLAKGRYILLYEILQTIMQSPLFCFVHRCGCKED